MNYPEPRVMPYRIASGSAGTAAGRRSSLGADRLRLRTLAPGESHEVAGEVSREDAGDLDRKIGAMLDFMRRAGYPALAGPLVGLPIRVIAIDLSRSGESQIVLINPVLEELSADRQLDREGCIAMPGVTALVDRHQWVVATGWTRNGQLVRLHAGGILGRIIQHQIDHLDGVTFIDRVGVRERARVEARLRAVPRSCSYHPR